MNTLDIMKASLRIEEGLRLTPYKCTAGKLTIGYGHNIDANPLPKDMAIRLKQTGLISRDDAETLLGLDANAAMNEAKTLPCNWDALTPNRQAVIAEMVFQMGIATMRKFAATLKAVRTGDYMLAKTQMLQSKWATQTPARARRYAERMLTG